MILISLARNGVGMTPKTIYVFVLLFVSSWIVELWIGTRIVVWYWSYPWFAGRGQQSMAETIASFGSYTPPAPSPGESPATHGYNWHWTPGGVVTFFLVLFLFLHLVYAIRFALLDPVLKRRRLGARRPSEREQEQFRKVYQALARTVSGFPVARPRRYLVVDGLGLQMRYIGYVLVIDRELLWHRHFPALLAVELGHANSEDRLARRLYQTLPFPRALFGIAGGLPFGIGHVVLFPLWAWYWKERIYAADAFAVECGQGHALIRGLDEIYLKLDRATKWGRWMKPVPYVEERIDRIRREEAR